MRFQDAARDGRAVVYAGDPGRSARGARRALLATPTPRQRVLARAVMNGEIDRSRRPGARCSRRLFGDDAPCRPTTIGPGRGDPRCRASRSPSVATQSAASPRRDRRGDDRAAAGAPSARGDGPARATDPVRRRPRRDPSLRRDGRARRRRRGLRLQVGRARDQRRRPPPARRRADPRRRRGRAARRSRSSSSMPRRSCEVRLARQTAPTAGIRLVSPRDARRAGDAAG